MHCTERPIIEAGLTHPALGKLLDLARVLFRFVLCAQEIRTERLLAKFAGRKQLAIILIIVFHGFLFSRPMAAFDQLSELLLG
jgi:hypothetical protein